MVTLLIFLSGLTIINCLRVGEASSARVLSVLLVLIMYSCFLLFIIDRKFPWHKKTTTRIYRYMALLISLVGTFFMFHFIDTVSLSLELGKVDDRFIVIFCALGPLLYVLFKEDTC